VAYQPVRRVLRNDCTNCRRVSRRSVRAYNTVTEPAPDKSAQVEPTLAPEYKNMPGKLVARTATRTCENPDCHCDPCLCDPCECGRGAVVEVIYHQKTVPVIVCNPLPDDTLIASL